MPYTLKEVCESLKVTRATAYHYVKALKLKANFAERIKGKKGAQARIFTEEEFGQITKAYKDTHTSIFGGK